MYLHDVKKSVTSATKCDSGNTAKHHRALICLQPLFPIIFVIAIVEHFRRETTQTFLS